MVGAFRIFRLCVDRQIDRSMLCMGLPQWLSSKESACNAGGIGDMGLICGLGRSPGKGNGYPLQCSCLKNPMDKRSLWATVHGLTKSQTGLSD